MVEVFVLGMLGGAVLTNIRYWLLYRKFKDRHFVIHRSTFLYEKVLARHFVGTVKGNVFLYCPIGRICSWSTEDVKHEWCAYCKEYIALAEGADDAGTTH